MLGFVRRQLWRIRYYSASPARTVWTRAADAMLIGSLALAVLAVFVGDAAIARPRVGAEQGGTLKRSGDQVTATLTHPEGPLEGWTAEQFGHFSLIIIEEDRGWPFTTSKRIRPAQLRYDLIHEPKKRFDRTEDADAPLRDAVEAALIDHGRAELLQSWRATSASRSNASILRWFFGAGAWWILLYGLGTIGLLVARVGTTLYEKRARVLARRRRRAGQCIRCGYDLRGIEYSERCPECGELT